jgi:inorganic triphosphatase YgiF
VTSGLPCLLPPRGLSIATETELKLAARTGDLPAVRRALEAMANGSGVSRARLISTYYDTPDHALARRGSSLRVRRHGKRYVQTLKATGEVGELARGEWEDAVAGERPDPHAAQTGPFLSPEIAGQLRPLFRTEVTRTTIPLAPEPATRIEAAIDRGRIRNGENGPPTRISEIELELKSGAPAALYDVALKLLHVAPLRLEPRSKAERGYRLSDHEDGPAKAVHAASLDLRQGISAETVLQRVGRACLDHMLRNEDAALAGDVEGIHQMRVAVRRLRAVLSAFADLLPREQRRWASGELRWFADILGETRNLDVFSSGLLRPARAALSPASEFDGLGSAIERRRRAAHKAVVKAISSTRYTETMLALLRWFDGREWRRDGDGEALGRPIEEIAPLLLERCRRKAEKRGRDFAGQSPRQRHQLRIALKKLRYTAELLGSLYDPGKTRQFVQRLKRLQDELGDTNDVRVGRGIITGLARPGSRSRVARAGRRVLAWHRRRLGRNEHRLRQHLSELRNTDRFW